MKNSLLQEDLDLLNQDGSRAFSEMADDQSEVTVAWMIEFLKSKRSFFKLDHRKGGYLIESRFRPEFHEEVFDALWSVCVQEFNAERLPEGRVVLKRAKKRKDGDRRVKYGQLFDLA